jgi:hypothetical protein
VHVSLTGADCVEGHLAHSKVTCMSSQLPSFLLAGGWALAQGVHSLRAGWECPRETLSNGLGCKGPQEPFWGVLQRVLKTISPPMEAYSLTPLLACLCQKTKLCWPPVAHACNPSYSGGRDQEDHGSKSAQANSSWDSISKIPITKMGIFVSGSKCRPWVQSPVLKKKKKRQNCNRDHDWLSLQL